MATAALGAALTPLTPWYRGLERPWFQLPDWAFGPALTLIFVLAAAGFCPRLAGWCKAPLLVAFLW